MEWLEKHRPLVLFTVFKGGELLLKSKLTRVYIDVYGNVTYTLHRTGFESEVVGHEAFVSFGWVEDEQSPAYGTDWARITILPTMNSGVEDGTLIIRLLSRAATTAFKLMWGDFTDIVALAGGVITWIRPSDEEPAFKIDVYDEEMVQLPSGFIDKIMGEPYNYLSPSLEPYRIE